MRFLHTSDWHLGRSFHQIGLLDAQAHFVDHLVEVVRSEAIDAVLVSGDIYDRALPAPDTVALLSSAAARIIDAGAALILSSGNHDSAIRLGFAAELLERSGLHIRTSIADIGRPVQVGDVSVYPLPYLEPSLAAGPLATQDRTHAGVLRAAMHRVRASIEATAPRHAVVMAHAFVTGGTTSDSERDIAVGGVAAVPPSVFDAVSYAALGHLHGRQQVGANARYSGSPVAMSFSEAAHTKGCLIADFTGNSADIDFVAAPVQRPLAVLRGTIDEILTGPGHRDAESAWCQITLTDPQRPAGAMERIRSRFPYAVDLRFEPTGVVHQLSAYAAAMRDRSDLDVCCDFVAHVRGRDVDDDERDVISQAVEGARLGRAASDDEGGLSHRSPQTRGVA